MSGLGHYTEIPLGWALVPLGDVCIPVNKLGSDGFPGARFRYIDIGSVSGSDQQITSADWVESKSAPGRARQIVQAGDTVYSTVRPYLRKIAYVPEQLDGHIASTGFAVIRPHVEINSRYLFYVVQSALFEKQLLPKQRGVSYPAVRDADVFETHIPIPPAAEQQRIVEALDDHLSRLNAASEAVTRAQRRIRPFVGALLDRIALGASSATHLDRDADSASQRLLIGLSSKRFDYASLPPLPEGWLWRRSSDVCEFINSGSTPKAHLMHAGSGDVPFLKVYNITQDGQVDFTNKPTYVDHETHENQLKRSRVRPGDVLTNIVGPPLGKTAVVPDQHPEWNINQAIVAFRAGPEVLPEWLALVLRSPVVLDMLRKTAKATAGQFNIALSTCRELPLPIPPIDVQIDLVVQSAGLLEFSDRFAAQVTPISLRAKNLRQAVLRRAFEGGLVPQAPTDEPASVLLERIRGERKAQNGKTKRTNRRPGKTVATADAAPPAATAAPTTAIQQELPL